MSPRPSTPEITEQPTASEAGRREAKREPSVRPVRVADDATIMAIADSVIAEHYEIIKALAK